MPNIFVGNSGVLRGELPVIPIKEMLIQKDLYYKQPRQVEELLNVRPEIQALFNRNEVMLDKDVAQVAPAKFGVLGHIDPTRNAFIDALIGVKDLRDKLGEESSILQKMINLLKEIIAKENIKVDPGKNETVLNQALVDQLQTQFDKERTGRAITAFKFSDLQDQVVAGQTKKVPVITTKTIMNLRDVDELDNKDNPSSIFSVGLFSLGNEARKDIQNVDNIHSTLMAVQSQLARLLTEKRNNLVKLDQEIPERQRELANLDQARLKALGESKMVAALVEENWRKVEADYQKRTEILTNHRGIYFVRASETPVCKSTLLDVDLRYGRLEDLVPGTAISHLELPDDIEPYIETIADMPIVNWSFFNPYWNQLPARETVLKWLDKRRLRLGYLARQQRRVSSKFNAIMQSHQAILQDYARFNIVGENSLQAFYREAVQIISLEDLLTGTPHQLRGRAQHFRNQLDQATHLLLSCLQSVTPSLRLDWATAAELDQLDLRQPNTWPGMQQAKLNDLSEMRTLVELLSWWWRQLNDNASSAAATALRNLLRAALMVAVGDDPKEMLHGYLQAIPMQFRAGELLRATLNRHAAIGTELQLVNELDQVVGRLHVEDADERGAVLRIAQLYNTNKPGPAAQFSLVGIKPAVRSIV